MPLLLLTPNNLKKKHFGFSLCDNILVLLDTPGHWLNWLPVDHNIIFISNDADWIDDYPRLTRLQNAFFFIPSDDDNGSKLGIYERRLFEDSFRKIPLQKVDEVMEEHLRVNYDYGGVNFRAVAFNFPPFSVLSPNGNDGYEFNIVSAIADALKLDLEVRTPTSGGMWGWQEPDGNYTGKISTSHYKNNLAHFVATDCTYGALKSAATSRATIVKINNYTNRKDDNSKRYRYT